MGYQTLRWLAFGVLQIGCAVAMTAQTGVVDPYTLQVVHAACGAEDGRKIPAGGGSSAMPLAAGMARVYVITAPMIFRSQGDPVLLGMDGRWFGQNGSHQYSFVDVPAGVHHLCAASNMKGVLPHTSAAMVLARVETVAGQSYYFFNRRTKLMNLLELKPINAAAAAMYLESLSSSETRANGKLPKLWQAPAVQAACGPKPNQGIADSVPAPVALGAPPADRALVYFFTGIYPGGGSVPQIRVAVDGQWVGELIGHSYVAVALSPGVHRLCSTAKFFAGVKPTLWLGRLDAAAGQTYLLPTDTFDPPDAEESRRRLDGIAGLKPHKPDVGAFDQASKQERSKATQRLEAERQGCGIPADDSSAPPPTAVADTRSDSSIVVLLRFDRRELRQRNALNVALDGRWAASLRSSSWVSLPVSLGLHRVCIHVASGGPGFLTPQFSPAESLFLFSAEVALGSRFYLLSDLKLGDEFPSFGAVRIDPDEGTLLAAFFPDASQVSAATQP